MNIEKIIKDGDLKALASLGFPEPKRALQDLVLLKESPFGEKGATFEELIKNALASASPLMALNNLERVNQNIPEKTLRALLLEENVLEYLTTLTGSSELLTGSICRHPEILSPLFLGKEAQLYKKKDLEIFIKELTSELTSKGDDALSATLRVYKQREYVRIGLRDLLGLASLEEVTAEIADLASASLEVALRVSLNELKLRFGRPVYIDRSGKVHEAGFTVIGMGKLGGRELNFSSDIDLIYLYTTEKGECEGTGGKAKISLHEFFVKVAERVSSLINEITDEGNVFRVDLDLRPEGRSGEIVNSLSSIETYYEAWGRTWERSAMIKARPVAGDMELGRAFLEMIEPFVYRKYLDFRAIEELKGMKERLDIELLKRKPGTIDVKLGIGGIREIEFFCQALLLIHGGKVAGIREKNTLLTLVKLVENSLLNPKDAAILRDGYLFLRRLEHRIQIVEGRQTHALPMSGKEASRIARMVSPEHESLEDFIGAYKGVTSGVYDIYRSLFYKGTEELEEKIDPGVLLLFTRELTDDEATEGLTKLGFKDAAGAQEALSTLRDGPHGVRLSASARMMLEKLSPFLLTRTLLAPDPDAALRHLNSFISAMGAHTTFYALLSENPKVAELLLTIFGTSDFLTRRLLEQPGALDHLLSSDLTTARRTKEEVADELSESLNETRSGSEAHYEEFLDTLRRFKGREVLRIGVNDILEELDMDGVFAQISTLAEVTLDAAIDIAADELSARYGRPFNEKTDGPKFGVIGLGKLGSRELIYGSDLDIIFVYSPGPDNSKGNDETELLIGEEKKISIHEYFVKLAQKIISVLTLRTREGIVFPVDMRLRPSGSAGPLVLTGASLIKYQREKAEIWEAQAMIKARAVAGDRVFAGELVDSLNETIYTRGLKSDELAEIRRIRGRMENEIAKEEPGRYNIKTGRGGVVDIEFLVQLLQMRFGAKKKALQTQSTLKALDALRAEELLSAKDHQGLKEAYSFFSEITVKLRVVHDRATGDIIEGSKELSTLARRLGYEDKGTAGAEPSKTFLDEYIAQSTMVRETYERVLDAL